jgi:hypothetical protein
MIGQHSSKIVSPRRRRLYRPAGGRLGRPITRHVPRLIRRSAIRRVWRTVIPYDGPTLNEICRLLEAYIRLANTHQKQRNPASGRKFQALSTPEESRRKFEADLDCCYGAAVREREPAASHFQPSAAATYVSPIPNPPAELSVRAPATALDQKKDIIAVPLVRAVDGTLGLDWSRAW